MMLMYLLPTGIPAAAVAAEGATKTANEVTILDITISCWCTILIDLRSWNQTICSDFFNKGFNVAFLGHKAIAKSAQNSRQKTIATSIKLPIMVKCSGS